jgi:hypothetical protein
MKKTNSGIKIFVAGILLMSVMFLNSCSKNIQDKSAAPVQDNSIDGSELAGTPVALWNFDSSWTEAKQHLIGMAHNRLKFSSTAQAHAGKAAFKSNDSGYVSYNNAGTALPNLTTGLTVDFWLYAYPKEGGAQCVWCLPQTGAFWPTQHVLLDGYNAAQGDSGLIKVMFKANKAIDYNEQWTVVGGIPNFYRHWTHVQYSYNGSTSKYTLKVNGHKYFDAVTLYDRGDSATRQPLGNLNPNPGTHGIVIGAFQNTWDPVLFGDRQPWMLGFKGRIDQLKIYNTALF